MVGGATYQLSLIPSPHRCGLLECPHPLLHSWCPLWQLVGSGESRLFRVCLSTLRETWHTLNVEAFPSMPVGRVLAGVALGHYLTRE